MSHFNEHALETMQSDFDKEVRNWKELGLFDEDERN
jgi:hypothetical protein